MMKGAFAYLQFIFREKKIMITECEVKVGNIFLNLMNYANKLD